MKYQVIKDLTPWSIPPKTGKKGRPATKEQRIVVGQSPNNFAVCVEYLGAHCRPIDGYRTTNPEEIVPMVARYLGVSNEDAAVRLEGMTLTIPE